MKERKIIVQSESPFSSPIVLVKKKDSGRRLCIDYRNLNKNTVRDVYPIPRMDDTLDSLGKAKVFTKIDLKEGYWQTPLDKSIRNRTAFRTHNNLFDGQKCPSVYVTHRLHFNG